MVQCWVCGVFQHGCVEIFAGNGKNHIHLLKQDSFNILKVDQWGQDQIIFLK